MLPLDAHAHIVPDIAPAQLGELNACVLAMTRSLEEFGAAADRADSTTAWGVGCHPALAKAQRAFSTDVMLSLLPKTPIIGEVGLDGTSRVPMEEQRKVFAKVLAVAARVPRVVSVHSYRATREVLEELSAHEHLNGVILHWWLGDPAQTLQAVRLGCWFSVNPASIRHSATIRRIPIERVLTETDHPYGDRYLAGSRPGSVAAIESSLASHYGRSAESVRIQVWRNFANLVAHVGCTDRLPLMIREQIQEIV